MHGSRPDLYQLRQLILAAVLTAAAIAIISGVIFCPEADSFSQSAATVVAIAKMEAGKPRWASNLREQAKAVQLSGLWSTMRRRLRDV